MQNKNEPLLLRPSGKDYLWGGSRLNDSFLFSFLFSVLKIGFVHFIHDAVHILRGQLSAGK